MAISRRTLASGLLLLVCLISPVPSASARTARSADAQPAPASGRPAELAEVLQGLRVDTVPADYVLLIDTSRSMDQAGLYGPVRRSLRTLLDALDPSDHVSLITFDAHPTLRYSGTATAESGPLQRLPAAATGASTDIGAAIGAGLRELERPDAQKVGTMLLFTDGKHKPPAGSPYSGSGGSAWRDLADRARVRSSPITGVNDEEQQRYPAIRTEEKFLFLARWEATQAGDPEGSPRRLSAELKASHDSSAAPWDDPHRILGVSLRHLIKMSAKMSALSCVPAMRTPYEKLLTGKVAVRGTERRVPLHLFPGEQLAARLELESMELLNQQVAIPAELISLFERSEELQRFAHALAFDVLSFTRDRARAELRWVYRAPKERGGQDEVALGTTALGACRVFCDPNGQLSRHVREAIVDELREKESKLEDAEYGKFLRYKASSPIVPENDATEPEELRKGLDRCLRMLLERHARKF